MKYVIVKNKYGYECAILFDGLLDHGLFGRQRVVAAGFCDVKGATIDGYNNPTTSYWGRSVTLSLSARPEDAEVIDRLINQR